METSAQIGRAVLGRAILGTSDMPDTSQDRFVWEGHCWELATDPDLDTALVRPGGSTVAQDRFAARLANILKLNVQNLVVTEGATINQLVAIAIAGATADFQEAFIQNLRSTGATLDEAVIGDLAANIITSGMFRTAAVGQRLEIDSTGLVMYGMDPDGLEYELVRIGPAGDNLITAGDTSISPAGVQAPSGSFEEIEIGGEDLATILQPLPRGVVARGWNEVGGRTIGPVGETELGEITVPVEDGRAYRMTMEPLSAYIPSGGRMALKIYIEKGYNGASAPAPTRSSRLYRQITQRDTGAANPLLLWQGSWLMWETEGATEWRLLFSMEAWDSARSGAIYDGVRPLSTALAVSVEDVGPFATEIMADRSGSTSAPKPTPPTVKRYTKTYGSTGYRCYNANGDDAGTPDVVQGLYAGGPSRLRRRGGWIFPSMTGDLSGATVEKMKVYLYMDHSYYTAGATVNPAVWGSSMKNNLDPFTSVKAWKRKTGKWITLPKSLHSGFKSGALDGFGVISTSSSAEQYARFKPSGAKIRITYVK